MTREEIQEIFEKAEVLLTGHFILTSGRHSEKYLQCARLLQYPKLAEKALKELAQNFMESEVDTVIGPAIGGIIVAYEVARALGARALFAERENGVMTLRRGFSIEPGERVLVVEDVVTTGGSVKEVIDVVRSCGGQVVGVGALVDRSASKVDFGVPFYSLLSMEVESYLPEECPLCKKGLPAQKPGSKKL
ncbi:orotate phosphoribosyltransferase [Caldanaerovirga acetigignens]|uniref:Orotate phosphoribosyltransferase n=1 Tax=Caldanaerovirga acetigignens TaxID=447595 RepID=A0A1M7M1T7_9FIRM|nr:orotate phosphoribosyltransferase [Caldanaerovirga acetigignens]SHM84147.1 orotate phosphoribosyltransferase [Caldanaerovirga acetigignens]